MSATADTMLRAVEQARKDGTCWQNGVMAVTAVTSSEDEGWDVYVAVAARLIFSIKDDGRVWFCPPITAPYEQTGRLRRALLIAEFQQAPRSLGEQPETAPARWYSVSKDGMATLCVDADDARKVSVDSDLLYTHAPHVATMLVPSNESKP